MKTLVIGIDGADFAVMNPWIRKGRLPNIARLISEGVSCPLKSTWPHNTSPAWPAMVTGMSPGNLGLYDFLRQDGYGKRLVSRLEIPFPAIWDILSKEDRGVVVVGVPMTYPPPRVKGAMVAGFLSPTGRNNGQPLDLIDRFPELRATSRFAQGADDLARRTSEVSAGTARLLSEYDWEFAMVVFNATDWVMHFNWGRPRMVRRVFEKVDAEVGRLVERARADNVVLVSDHGFGPVTHLVNVNRILADTGFLVDGEDVSKMYPVARDIRDEEGRGSDPVPRRLSRLQRLSLGLGRWIMGRVSGHLSDIGKFADFVSPKTMEGKGSPLAGIGRFDWSKTKAYLCSPSAMTINLNLEGREPKGCVAKDDFERVRDEVIAALEGWKDPDTGKRIFRWARRPEDIYEGARVKLAPDVFFALEPGLRAVGMRFGRHVWKIRGVGQHAPRGVFVGNGSMFRKAEIEEMSILDVAPTLLAGMSVKAPHEFDGKVVSEILS